MSVRQKLVTARVKASGIRTLLVQGICQKAKIRTGLRKRVACAVVGMLVLILVGGRAQAQEPLVLYDDFNAGFIDFANKWFVQQPSDDFIREVQNGRLHMFNRGFGNTDSDTGEHFDGTHLNIKNAGTITALESTVEVSDVGVTGCASNPLPGGTRAALFGDFFNTGTPTPGSHTNDVTATMDVVRVGNFDPPGVLRVNAFIRHCTNSSCSSGPTLGFNSLGTATLGQQIKLRMQWDPANNRFIFQRDDAPPVFSSYVVANAAPPGVQFKGLLVATFPANCTTLPESEAFMDAFFDDVFVSFSVPASDVVDCDSGGSVNTEINTNGRDFVQFTGTCDEFVFIGRSGVTVEGNSGDPSLDVITGGVTVAGATDVQIRNLTVNGGGGLSIRDGAVARVIGSTIQGTTFGFTILRNAFATLDGNTIGPAIGTTSDICAALCVGENSRLRMTNTTVTANSNDPSVGGSLAIFRGSVATIRGGNVITNTGSEPAVDVLFNSTFRQDDPSLPNGSGGSNGIDTINGSLGLRVFGDSYAEVRNGQVNGNTQVDLYSVLRIGGPFGSDPNNIVFNGDITVSRASGISVFDPLVTINGDVTCTDDESSLSGTFGGINTIDCTNFDNDKIKGK